MEGKGARIEVCSRRSPAHFIAGTGSCRGYRACLV
jgi:hypothetical protein